MKSDILGRPRLRPGLRLKILRNPVMNQLMTSAHLYSVFDQRD